jgi:hypothetical protein
MEHANIDNKYGQEQQAAAAAAAPAAKRRRLELISVLERCDGFPFQTRN